MSKVLKYSIVILLCNVFVSCRVKKERQENSTENDSKNYFTNPISRGADPWVIKHNGNYYFCSSGEKDGQNFISVSESSSLVNPGKRKRVFASPETGWNSTNIWAPELHHYNGKWYIYYAAGKSGPPYLYQRTGVLESVSNDPQGDYIDKGVLITGEDSDDYVGTIWAIDLTMTEVDGQLYGIWSGWEENVATHKTPQYLYISKMSNPYTISSERVKISSPEEEWETGGPLNLNEGPEILKHNGDIFIIYSTRESWTPEYRLGQLKLKKDSDPMVAENWSKKGPVFVGNEIVHGVGHASFTTSPDDTESWIIYHSKVSTKPGWNRNVRAQQFFWDENGDPIFGKPVQSGVLLKEPSRNN